MRLVRSFQKRNVRTKQTDKRQMVLLTKESKILDKLWQQQTISLQIDLARAFFYTICFDVESDSTDNIHKIPFIVLTPFS